MGHSEAFEKCLKRHTGVQKIHTALRSREMFERESTIVTGGEGVSEAAYFDKHLIELLIICFYTTIHIN